MGLYSEVFFPRICDLVMKKPFISKHRQALLAHAYGDVLEIGFGGGLNRPHYPKEVRKVTAVDPNVGMNRLAQKRIEKSDIKVDQRLLHSEHLPFEDDTFDCVVSTFTLCSVKDVGQSLAEVHRVLKADGRFLFLEHGLSPDQGVQKWHHRLNWLDTCLTDGCHLDRNIEELVVAQPFAKVEIEEFYLARVPRTHGYLYRGIAMKAGE